MSKQFNRRAGVVRRLVFLGVLVGASGQVIAQGPPAGQSVRPDVESLGALRRPYEAALRQVQAARGGTVLPVPAGFVRGTGPNVLPERLTQLALTYAARPTPRTQDGHPDLRGNWASEHAMIFGSASNEPRSAYDPVELEFALRIPDMMTAATQRLIPTNVPQYKPELVEKVRGLYRDRLTTDLTLKCAWPGVPRMGAPTRISQRGGGTLVFGYNEPNGPLWRIIDLNLTRIPDDADSTFGGISLPRWEGETLVIESHYLPADTWLGEYGYIHGLDVKIIEKFHRKGDIITYQVTVEDPEVLTQPWTRDPITLFRVEGLPAEPVRTRCNGQERDPAQEGATLLVTRLY